MPGIRVNPFPFIFAAAGLLLAVISLVLPFSLWNMNRRAFLYDTLQLSAFLSESNMSGDTLPRLPEGVLYWGSFDREGTLLKETGERPSAADELLLADRLLSMENRSQFIGRNLYYLRPVGQVGINTQRFPGLRVGERRMQQTPLVPEQPGWVLVVMEAGSYWRTQVLYLGIWLLIEVLVVFLAISALRLQRRNVQMEETLAERQRLAQLGEAARTLTHEIKNPLAAMKVQTALLKRKGGEAITGNLTILEEEMIRISGLVDRVGDFLRQPAGEPVRLDPEKVIREIHSKGHFSFELEVRSSAFTRIDHLRFLSVLENLLSNAAEADPEGNSEVRVEKKRSELVIEVLDRGPGIPSGDLEEIFTPFVTTKSRGTGIGLAISRRFIEAAGGRLSASNREGGGACLRISLPVEDA